MSYQQLYEIPTNGLYPSAPHDPSQPMQATLSQSSYSSRGSGNESMASYSSDPMMTFERPWNASPIMGPDPPPLRTAMPCNAAQTSQAMHVSSFGYDRGPTMHQGLRNGSPPISPDVAPFVRALDSCSTKREKIYMCIYPGCSSKGRPKRQTDLTRHIRTHHLRNDFSKWCEELGCRRSEGGGGKPLSSARMDHYQEHLRKVHKRDIPKSHKKRRSDRC